MTEAVYNPAKPNGVATANTANPTPNPNPTNPKPHPYNPTRIPYRPTPTAAYRHDRSRCNCRRCFCLCCFWSILTLLILLLLAAIAGAAFYVLYRPQRPSFSISSLKISQFNLTTTASDDTTRLTTKLNLTISSKNPNKRITYSYDPISISAFSGDVLLANGSFANFTSNPSDIDIIHSTLSQTSQLLDADSVTSLRSDLKKKSGLPVEIVLDTRVLVKMEKLKSKKVGIRVKCEGIHGLMPKGKVAGAASVSNAKCKVDLRIKIWKFNF